MAPPTDHPEATAVPPGVCKPGYRGKICLFLISDRAGQFTASFGAILASVGIRAMRISPHARAKRSRRPVLGGLINEYERAA